MSITFENRERNDELTALCNLITSYYSQLDRCLFLSSIRFFLQGSRFVSTGFHICVLLCALKIVFIFFTFFGTFSCGFRSLFHVDVFVWSDEGTTPLYRLKAEKERTRDHTYKMMVVEFTRLFFFSSSAESSEKKTLWMRCVWHDLLIW